jgi:phage protein D
VSLNSEDSDEAKQLALGMLQSNSYKFMRADGAGEGNYKLRPGARVTIKMVGEPYEGEYMAETVTHHFDHQSGYTAEFTLKRNLRL